MPKPLKDVCIVKDDGHEGDVVGETFKIYSQGLGDCEIEHHRRPVGRILRRSRLFLHFSRLWQVHNGKWRIDDLVVSFEDDHVSTPFCEHEGGQQADNWPGSNCDN